MSVRRLSLLLQISSLFSLVISTTLIAQESKEAAIQGKLTNPRAAELPVDFIQLKPHLIEEVKLPNIPVPAAILSMTREQRKQWFSSYRESESGKEVFAERKRLLDNRKVIEIKANTDGNFELLNVPQGDYSLAGETTKQFGKEAYHFEISADIEVGDRDKIQLGEIPIRVRRVVQVGESFPQFELPRFDDHDMTITNKDLNGSFALVYFWGTDSEFSSLELESVVALQKKLAQESANILFLGVCLDQKEEIDPVFLSYRQLDLEAWSGGAESKALELFGVRSVPYYCLVNPEGKVVANHDLCQQLFQKTDMNIEAIVRETLKGTDLQTLVDK